MKTFLTSTYLGSSDRNPESPGITILGCPLDATSSFRGGTRFAPDSIRKASWTLETYSPYLKRDLEDMALYDAGNLELYQGDVKSSLDIIEAAVAEMVAKKRKMLLFGGEHLVTFPVLKAVRQAFSAIQVVHFDAHCDLRDEYEGQTLSHATAIRRVKDLGVGQIHQVGIRSGTREEFEELVSVESPEALANRLVPDVPVYVTFDMDVLDPSLVPGVTTPEPGGPTFREVMDFFSVLSGREIIGADIVELTPDYDHSFVSSICAAKVARELLMLLNT